MCMGPDFRLFPVSKGRGQSFRCRGSRKPVLIFRVFQPPLNPCLKLLPLCWESLVLIVQTSVVRVLDVCPSFDSLNPKP